MSDPKLTRLATKVLNALVETNEPVKPNELVTMLDMNLRSVRYALKLLQEADIVGRQPDLGDLRTYYYYIPANVDPTPLIN